MNRERFPALADGRDEIAALISLLHQTSKRLEELTGGEVDAVADTDGHTFVLRHAQDQLRASEAARQAAILNALPAHIALLDGNGVIVSVNEAWRRFGRDNALQGHGSAIGVNYLETCDVALGECAAEAHAAAAGIRSVLSGEEQTFSLEYSCHSPRESRWFLMTAAPLARGSSIGAVVMHLDVTARRAVEEELREGESRFRQMAENIHEVFWLTDPAKSQVLYVSPAYEEIWGRRCDSLRATPLDWIEAIHPDDRARVLAAARAQADGKYVEEYRIVRPDGAIRWIRDRAFPVLRNGEVYRIAGLAEDITQRRHSRDELRESERRFSDMLGNVEMLSLMLDRDGRITYCNGHLLRITGWKLDEVIGENWFEKFIPARRTDVKNELFGALLAALPSASHYENEILTRSGESRTIQWNNTLLRSASGEVIGTASLGEDITERIRLEGALRESEAGLRRAQKVARLSHVIVGADGTFESWSDTVQELIGVERGQGPRTTSAWMEMVHPDDRAQFRAKVIEAGTFQRSTEIEYRVRRGEFERHIFQVMEPLQDCAGDAGVRWFCTIQDVTERKRAEEEVRRLNSDLERRVAERTAELMAVNKELEAFDYSVAHDLRAPLNRIEGFGAMLGEQYGDKLDARGRDLLSRIVEAGRSMDQLVGDLFELSTVTAGELDRRDVDMSALCESIIAALRRSEPERNVRFEAPAGLHARGDPGLVRVVLENLLGNAWKFTKLCAEPRIEMGSAQVEGERTYFVRDNGAGFDAVHADKLFLPFQRLHPSHEFEGTGIGLATVQRIVRRHGGRVWAEAAVDRGATFFFTLA